MSTINVICYYVLFYIVFTNFIIHIVFRRIFFLYYVKLNPLLINAVPVMVWINFERHNSRLNNAVCTQCKALFVSEEFVTILNLCTFWDVIDLLVLEKKFENLNLFSFFLNYVPFKRSWPFSRTSLKSLHKKNQTNKTELC